MQYDISNTGRLFSYSKLWENYQEALETIRYYEEKISQLNDELDSWVEAYEETADKLYG